MLKYMVPYIMQLKLFTWELSDYYNSENGIFTLYHYCFLK